MPFTWREAVIGAAVLFVVFLLVKMRPSPMSRSKLSADIRDARDRAHRATTPRARATALLEAADLAVGHARWTAAAGFFLRAMSSDPEWAEAVQRTVQAFHKRRPHLLEKILWRRLATLSWDDEHRGVTRAITAGLAHLYRHEIRDHARAEVMERLARSWQERPSSSE